jgi:hypothetical protein
MVALFELGARRAADAVRNGEQTAETLAEALLARCAAASPLRAAGPLHGVPLALGQHRYGRFSGCDREKRFPSPAKP